MRNFFKDNPVVYGSNDIDNNINNGIHTNHLQEQRTSSEERNERDLIAEEDNIVEQYDALLQKSRAIRERLSRLRNSLSNLESKKQKIHDRHHQSATPDDIHLNTINHDNDAHRSISRKHEKYEAYQRSVRAKQQHQRRQQSEVDNDIWEDQWKSKIAKHDHLNNHL